MALNYTLAWTNPSQAPPGGSTGPIQIASGGTGAITASAALSNLGAAANGSNSDITSLTGLTTPLGAAYGGTGVSSAGASGNVLTSNGTAWTSAASGGGVPSGAVSFFNLSSCPTGWTALTAAQGRYLVGVPSGGTLAGTDGTALSNLEDRPTGAHSHSTNISMGYNTQGSGCIPYANTCSGGTSSWGSSTAGLVAGTNAPYMQLLVCQKN